MNTNPIGLIYITASPERATDAMQLGIDRVMVDLEVRGKAERQSGQSLRLSGHTLADVESVAQVIPTEQFIVRIDPWHDESAAQIEAVLRHDPGTIMLPMISGPDEVRALAECIDGRAAISWLIETSQAVARIDELFDAAPTDQIHIGLNDLRLDTGRSFLFEPVIDGTIDPVFRAASDRRVPCGLGGIARLDEGLVPGRAVLAELIHRGASDVILSRTFIRGGQATTADDPEATTQVAADAVHELRRYEAELLQRSPDALAAAHCEFTEAVQRVVEANQTG